MSLLQEIDLLKLNDQSLSDVRQQMKNKLADLQARRQDLMARLDVKKNSADIDADYCVAARKNLKYDNFVS